MSAEFKVGDRVSGDDYDRLPVGTKAAFGGFGSGITKVGEHEWHDSHGCPPFDVTDFTRTLTHLPDAPEPEDTDDPEPEPLKEGDWVQVWAQVEDEQYINTESNVLLSVVDAGGGPGNVWARYDAIVRPDAGQVPPWVKRAPLTIDPNDEDGAVAELAHAIAEHCGVSVTFADLAKALAERSAAEGGAS